MLGVRAVSRGPWVMQGWKPLVVVPQHGSATFLPQE